MKVRIKGGPALPRTRPGLVAQFLMQHLTMREALVPGSRRRVGARGLAPSAEPRP